MDSNTEGNYEYDAPKHFIDFQNISNLDDDSADVWFDQHAEGTFEDFFLQPGSDLTPLPPSVSNPLVPGSVNTESLVCSQGTKPVDVSAKVPESIYAGSKQSIPVGRETFVVTKSAKPFSTMAESQTVKRPFLKLVPVQPIPVGRETFVVTKSVKQSSTIAEPQTVKPNVESVRPPFIKTETIKPPSVEAETVKLPSIKVESRIVEAASIETDSQAVETPSESENALENGQFPTSDQPTGSVDQSQRDDSADDSPLTQKDNIIEVFCDHIKHPPKVKAVAPIIKNKSFKSKHRPCREAAQKATSVIHSLFTPKKCPSAQVKTSQAERLVGELKRKRSQTPQTTKTYEDLQLEEVKRLQKETAKRLRQSRRSFAKLSKCKGPVFVKGSMPATEPMEFKFHQTTREKKGTVTKMESRTIHPENFFMTLRSNSGCNFNPNIDTAKPPTPTEVKPFKFHLQDRLGPKSHTSATTSQPTSSSLQSHPEVPMAEAIAKYQKTTPPRFRRSMRKPLNAMKSSGPTDVLTMPKTPNLFTKYRVRPITVKSIAMEEEEEIEKMKHYKFKANPINPDIMNKAGLYGVPRKITSNTTVPLSPMLATNKRILEKKEEIENVDSGETETDFHAKPMPNFERVLGVPSKRPLPITNPESPALSLKRRRLHEDVEGVNEQEVGVKFKAQPLPDFNHVFMPHYETKKTEPAPFSFEERYKSKPSRETFVEMIIRKEKHPDFKAQSIPDFGSGPSLPLKPTIPATKVQPFNLESMIRSQQYEQKWQEKVEKEIEQAKEATEFKAHDAKVLYTKPFQPHQSTRLLTDTDDFVLNSEIRSRKRTIYNAKLQKEALRQEQDNLRRNVLKEIQERKELTEFRKTLVHKAQPVNEYPPVTVVPSEKIPTVPVSPYSHTESRLRMQ